MEGPYHIYYIFQDKLVKEERNTRFNMYKITHQWRNIMRASKSRELKNDIEILSQTFERVVDRKDSVIKSLVKDLQEAEEQYAMGLRSHLQNMDGLVGKSSLWDGLSNYASSAVHKKACKTYVMSMAV